MAVSESFSHKIAAALERNAIRDLYDLTQWEAMGSFDMGTLKNRLAKLSLDRAKPKAVSLGQAAQMLKKRIEGLDQKTIEKDLHPFLPDEYRPGVLNLIRASVTRIIRRLENE